VRAADPAVRIVELQRKQPDGFAPIGAAVFLAVHPTFLAPDTPLFGADLFGVAAAALERPVSGAAPLVVGFFNGAEGDIVARRSTRGIGGAIAEGETLAGLVGRALTGSTPKVLADVNEIAARRSVVDTKNDAARQCTDPGTRRTFRLAGRAVYGAAALGGGEDDYTPLRDLGWRDGVRDMFRNEQGVKLPALQSRILRGLEARTPGGFPRHLPLHWLEIASGCSSAASGVCRLMIATVPTEMTTAAGFQARAVLTAGNGGADTFLLVGLANEYAGYTSSPDEYPAQDYMGASTAWGPDESPFFACKLDALRQRPSAGSFQAERVGPKWFNPGWRTRRFVPWFVSPARREHSDDELEAILTRAGSREPVWRMPRFSWSERIRAREEFSSTAAREVVVEQWDQKARRWEVAAMSASRREDARLVVTLDLAERPRVFDRWVRPLRSREWTAIWIEPLAHRRFLVRDCYRFRIRTGETQPRTFRSPAFTVTPQGEQNSPPGKDCSQAPVTIP
jgi:hypothetical protein